jgi:hypothetical protein
MKLEIYAINLVFMSTYHPLWGYSELEPGWEWKKL